MPEEEVIDSTGGQELKAKAVQTPVFPENGLEISQHVLDLPDGAQIDEYSNKIDIVRKNLTTATESPELEEARAYVEAHIDEMLSLFERDGSVSNQTLTAVNFTLLSARISGNESLEKKIEDFFAQKEDLLERMVVPSGTDSLPFIANLYNGATSEQKNIYEKLLSDNIAVFDKMFEEDDIRFPLSFLDGLQRSKFSVHSETFRRYLASHIDALKAHITPENLPQTEQILQIIYGLYVKGEFNSSPVDMYLNTLAEHREVLLSGLFEGKFKNEMVTLLGAPIEIEAKRELVRKIGNQFEEANPDMKERIIELLSGAVIATGQNPEIKKDIYLFFDKNCDAVTDFVFKGGGKFNQLEILMNGSSDESMDAVFHKIDESLAQSNDAITNARFFHILNESVGQRAGSVARAMSLYETHLQKIQDVMFDPFLMDSLKGWKLDVYKHAVSNLAIYGSPEVSQKAVEMVCTVLNFDPEAFFSQYGLDDAPFVEAWRQGMGDVFENFTSNKYAVERLVGERGVDCTSVLFREFGIKNFSRYPTELLVRQYDERNDTKKPYGMLMFSTFDHGKAFNSEDDRMVMRSLASQLGEGFAMRFGEAGSRFELVKRLLTTHKRYGNISFGLIGAHGADDMFQLGFGGERKEISVEDLKGAATEKIGELFEEGATLILESCSTGADRGIAEELSKKLGLKVIAPKEDSGGIETIKANISQYGKPPEFDINFWYTKGREFQMGKLTQENSAIE